MKILIIQEYSRHIENVKYRECLCFERAFKRLGHDAYSWGLGHPNFDKPIDFDSFDLILCCENYGDSWIPNLANYKKPYKIFYAIDPHVRGIEPYEAIVRDKGFDFMFVAVRDFCTKSNTAWLPPAIDEELFYNKQIIRDIPVGFVGHVATVERNYYLQTLKSKLNLSVNLEVFGDAMVDLLNRFKISFNKNISNDTNYRNFESIACGSLLITDDNPALYDLGFKHGVNCLMYKTVDDIVSFFPLNEKNYDTITNNGIELAKKHTYTKRCISILNFFKKINEKNSVSYK